MKLEIAPGIVAISGGLGDIGLATSRLFAEAGCRVALGDMTERPVCLDAGWFYQKVDVSDADAVEAWYASAVSHFGETPAYIIPNAAMVTMAPHLEVTPAQWKREIDVNLNGAFYFANAGVTRLVKAGRPGRVVFVGSWAGHAPHRVIPAYSVAKAGMRMLNQTLALELAPHGILVNEIAPGYVDAGLSGRIFEAEPENRIKAQARVPINRLLTAKDVASQIFYLCSDVASQITGTTLLQDGGLSLCLEAKG